MADEKQKVKMFKITFHSGDAGTEAEDVQIALNGKLNLYKRNVEALIDENFLGVLKDAVVYTEIEDANGKRVPVTIPRFAYSVTPA
jgi:hypothetical protein